MTDIEADMMILQKINKRKSAEIETLKEENKALRKELKKALDSTCRLCELACTVRKITPQCITCGYKQVTE